MSFKRFNMIRKFSSNANTTFFVTTPIYYVTAKPHIGHLYSSVIADAIHRWHRISHPQDSYKFSTGTDEHGLKIQQTSLKHNMTPSALCDNVTEQYKNLAKQFSIDYTDFIRTKDLNHQRSVNKLWNVLQRNGKIYSAKYSGWYSVPDETFLSEDQLKEKVEPDGSKTIISGESGHPVQWVEEMNYMFQLSFFQDDIKYWLNQSETRVRPAKFQKMLLALLEEPLPDLSVSRSAQRVYWGLPVPDDGSQTIYVWLDALANYLTVAGYGETSEDENFQKVWPPKVQVIGKDILKFHGIYWPAFLMAAGLEPPLSILCHSHWTVENEKMSKSKNNVVCPFELGDRYTPDGLRYFLLREGVAHSDGNYSEAKLIRIINSELADTLGNLLSRCCGHVLNSAQIFPQIEPQAFQKVAALDVTKKLIDEVSALPDVCSNHYSNFNFYKAVDSVIATLHQANLFFETLKPWELKKQPSQSAELDVVLHITLETLRVCGILLQPIIPNLSGQLLDRLSVSRNERNFENTKKKSWNEASLSSRKLGLNKDVLFKRTTMERKNSKAN